jgi:ribosome-associated translation inhibitor RaiA
MSIALEIDFRHLPPSPAIEAAIRQRVERLDRFHPKLMSCRVIVDAAHRHQGRGPYSVHLVAQVPGRTLSVSHDRGGDREDFYITLRDAVDALRRQLEDCARVERGDVKTHPSPAAPSPGG